MICPLLPRFLFAWACLGLAPWMNAAASPSATTPQPTRSVVYKRIGDVTLKLDIFEPTDFQPGQGRAGIVLFFGGSWISGSPAQFYPQCAHFAARGMVAIAAEYRIQSKHGTSPREAVMDGKSCLRWVRTHAAELGIDPARLVAGGGSAGGHVAAAAAILPGLNDPADGDTQPIPIAALVLFNPVIDNGPGGFGYDRVKDYFQEISPRHNLRSGLPPTLALFGTRDKFVPVATAQSFQAEMIRLGNRCELKLYPDQPHGFFNARAEGNPYFEPTLSAADIFLESLRLQAPESARR